MTYALSIPLLVLAGLCAAIALGGGIVMYWSR